MFILVKVGNGHRKEKCLLEIFLIDFSIHQASNLLSCLNNTISSLKQRLFQLFNSFRNPNVALLWPNTTLMWPNWEIQLHAGIKYERERARQDREREWYLKNFFSIHHWHQIWGPTFPESTIDCRSPIEGVKDSGKALQSSWWWQNTKAVLCNQKKTSQTYREDKQEKASQWQIRRPSWKPKKCKGLGCCFHFQIRHQVEF